MTYNPCAPLSCTAHSSDNCPVSSLFSFGSGGLSQGRWQGQWFLFMWAAASGLILNTGGERDGRQEGGRTRRWHVQLGRLMVSLRLSPQCVGLGAETRAPLCWGQYSTQCSVYLAAALINETETTQKTGSASGREFTGLSFFNEFNKSSSHKPSGLNWIPRGSSEVGVSLEECGQQRVRIWGAFVMR